MGAGGTGLLSAPMPCSYRSRRGWDASIDRRLLGFVRLTEYKTLQLLVGRGKSELLARLGGWCAGTAHVRSRSPAAFAWVVVGKRALRRTGVIFRFNANEVMSIERK